MMRGKTADQIRETAARRDEKERERRAREVQRVREYRERKKALGPPPNPVKYVPDEEVERRIGKGATGLAGLATKVSAGYTPVRKTSKALRAVREKQAELAGAAAGAGSSAADRTGAHRASLVPQDSSITNQQSRSNIGSGRKTGRFAPPSQDGEPENYTAAELRKLIALADERELKVQILRGSVAPVSELNVWYGAQIVKVRGDLLQIPKELRDQLAGETDPNRIEEMLDIEIRRVLSVMCEFKPKVQIELGEEKEGKEDGNADPAS